MVTRQDSIRETLQPAARLDAGIREMLPDVTFPWLANYRSGTNSCPTFARLGRNVRLELENRKELRKWWASAPSQCSDNQCAIWVLSWDNLQKGVIKSTRFLVTQFSRHVRKCDIVTRLKNVRDTASKFFRKRRIWAKVPELFCLTYVWNVYIEINAEQVQEKLPFRGHSSALYLRPFFMQRPTIITRAFGLEKLFTSDLFYAKAYNYNLCVWLEKEKFKNTGKKTKLNWQK